MSVLSDIVAKFRAASPNIAAAFDEVERRLLLLEGQPSPTNLLRWAPPALTTPTTINITAPGTYNLTGDTIVKVNVTSTSGGRVTLQGGRHRVIVGGYSKVTGGTDPSAVMVEAGDSTGVTHLEGMYLESVNAITLRTNQLVQIQNCHAKVATPADHADLIQVWKGSKAKGIRVHRFTGHSAFTFFSDLTDEPGVVFGTYTPAYWELYDVDLHGPQALNNWMGSPAHAVWKGSNCWLETSTEPGGNRRDLGDQLRQFGEQYNPKHAGYQILDTNGTVLYTQQPGVASGAPGDVGRLQGHVLRYLASAHPNLTVEWRCQLPPGGEFVPASSVGTGYVSPGYV